MANRTFHGGLTRHRGVVHIDGIVKIVGNTTPANAAVTLDAGLGIASVARTGTGEYTITLDDKYVQLLGARFTLGAATAIDLVPQIKSHDVTSAKTIVVNLCAGATPTDSANNVTHYIHFSLALRNSTVK